MSIEIRPMIRDDLGEIVDLSLRAWIPVFDSMLEMLGEPIFQQLFGADWQEHQAQDVRRACRDFETFVAVDDDQVVGFTALDVSDDETGEIYMVAVDPLHQGRGIGLQLTNFGVERLRQAGKRMAIVGTGGDPGHAAARATYTKAGFTKFSAEQYYLML